AFELVGKKVPASQLGQKVATFSHQLLLRPEALGLQPPDNIFALQPALRHGAEDVGLGIGLVLRRGGSAAAGLLAAHARAERIACPAAAIAALLWGLEHAPASSFLVDARDVDLAIVASHRDGASVIVAL